MTEESAFRRAVAAVMAQVLGSVVLAITLLIKPRPYFQHMNAALQPLLAYGLLLLIIRVEQWFAYGRDLDRRWISALESYLDRRQADYYQVPRDCVCLHCRPTGDR